jgi:hypothetical protein
MLNLVSESYIEELRHIGNTKAPYVLMKLLS